MNGARNKQVSSMHFRRCIRVFRALAGFLAFMGGCSDATKPEPGDPPVVVAGVRCDEPTWYVGLTDPQKQRNNSHSFTLQNETDQTIPIREIKPDCGCILPAQTPKEIPARGSVGIDVSYQASPVPGEFNHTVVVKLGAAEPGNLLLKIRGTIIPSPALHSEPRSLNFGRLMYNDTKTQTVVVSRYDFSRVRISRLTSALKGCTTDSEPAQDSEAMLVSVTVDAAALGPGFHSSTVQVATENSAFPSLDIPIKVDVGTMADLFRSTLLIDSIAPGGHHDFSVYRVGLPIDARPNVQNLVFTGDSDIQVDRLSPEKTGDGMEPWQLRVSSNAKAGVVKRGTLRISVSSGPSDVVEVPVIVFVK